MRRMKVSLTLWAGLMCTMFAFAARATAAPDAGNPPSTPANTASTAHGTANARDARIEAQGAPRRASAAPQGVRQSGAGSAERLHSLLGKQAHGHLARQPSRPVGSIRAASGVPGVLRPARNPAISKRSAPPLPKLTAMPRNPAIGGPRVQSAGRLGSAAIGRINRGGAMDGMQFHHKL
jgi:hypothetical protein